MTVAVSGGSGIVTYQWQSSPNTTSANFTNIPGANTTSYVPPSTVAGTTYYRVYISATGSGCGAAVSNYASAVIYNDITIGTQPIGGDVCVGGSMTLNVVASGSPGLNYEWQRQAGANWITVGTNSTSYVAGPLSTTSVYRVLVYATQSGCQTAVSNAVTITVSPDIEITSQPTGGSVCTGGNLTLNVVATGSPGLNYQWQYFSGGNWVNAGSNQASYNTGALSTTTLYRVLVFANQNGCETATSNEVSVIVTPDITIITQPVGGSICTGGDFDMSIVAVGSPAPFYQWEINTGSGWSNISGAVSANFNTGALTATTDYRVYVYSNASGCEDVYSNIISVVVTADIVIATPPVGTSICAGGSHTMTVSATGSPGLNYQWEIYNGSSWTNISGATTSTYIASSLSATTQYRVYVYANQSGCEDVYSSPVTVTVFPDISITAQPVGGSICTGGNFNLSVTASGSPDIHYQWQSYNGSLWSNVGSDIPTYNTGVLSATTTYRVFINADENGCEDVYSSEVVVTVTPDIAIQVQPVGGSICTGGNFTLSATATGSPAIQYQWEILNGSTWEAISGANSATYNTGSLTTTTSYRIFVSATEDGCEDVYSNIAIVTVTPDITISGQPAGGSVCVGGTWLLNVVAAGSPGLSYQWQDSIGGGTWQNVSEVGGTTSSFTTDVLTVTTWYRVFVYNNQSGCEDVFSSTVAVLVTPDIVISANPVGGSICTGGNFDLTVTASGSPAIQYQWEILNGSTWDAISGATAPAYNTGVLTTTTQYRVFVYATQNGCEDVYSSIVTVTVTPDIAISAQPVGGSICEGGNFDLSVTASGSPDIHYQWQQLTLPSTWNVVGGDQNTYNTGALASTTTYRVFVSADESGCEDLMSVDVTVVVTADIAISAQPVGGSICTGGNFDLSVTASGSPSIQYQWEQLNGSIWTPIVGATSPTYNTGILTGTTLYRVFVSASQNGCEDVYSSIVTVTVTPDIAISVQPIGGAICTGGDFNLSVTASGSPDIHYQWQAYNGSSWSIVGTDLPTYNTGSLSATTSYRVYVNADESGCEDIMSAEVIVAVSPDIAISAQPFGGSVCTGGNFNLSVTASGSPDIHYQWQAFNGTSWNVVGSDLATYTTGALTSTTSYRVFISADESGCEDIMSSEVIVTVTPDITISAQPLGGSICTGGNFDLSVTASGSPDIHYQWQLYNGTSWSIVGSDIPSYNTGTLTTTTTYRVFINADESGCEDIYSSEVVVIVTPDIAIQVQPVGGSICAGGNFALNATATGSPSIQYQWELLNGSTWETISGANSATYNTGELTGTTSYRIFVSAAQSGCEDVYSDIAIVTVTPDISISGQPVGGDICVGGTWLLNVIAAGSPGITYQWQDSIVGGNWQNVSEVGGTSSSFTSDILSVTTWYRVFLSANQSGCEDIFSSTVMVAVSPDIVISADPVGGSVCEGGDFNLSVTASGSPSIQYQWQIFNGSVWNDISGATSPSYNTGALGVTTQYRVFVSASQNGCEDIYSAIVSVVVTPDIAITTQPLGGDICTGGDFDLSVVATGSPDIHYQWQAYNGSTWVVVGADSPNYNTGALTGTIDYRVFVSADESGCEDVYSQQVTVTVTPDILISTQPVGGSICTGGNFDLSVTAAGSPAIQYQWERFNGSTWESIPGAIAPAFNTGALTGTTQYRVFVSASQNGCEDVYSSIVTVTVTPDIAISVQPVGGSVCTGGNFDLSVTASGSPDIHFEWQSFNGTTWSVVGADSPMYNTGALTATTNYRVFVNADESGCEDVLSAEVIVNVTPDISITTHPVGGSICTGGNFDLNVIASGSPAIQYQWEIFTGGTWTSIPGATGASYNTGVLTETSIV